MQIARPATNISAGNELAHPASLATSVNVNGNNNTVPEGEQAMVVFDLVRTPPIVLTANLFFCRLFGYTLDEVVGKPWKMFIHPDHLARTFQQLQQEKLSSAKIQFVQVYVNKQGRPFVAHDTH